MRFRFLCALLVTGLLTVAPSAVAHAQDTVHIETPEGLRLPLLSFPASGDNARSTGVVLLHGGGWRWGEAVWMAERAAELAALGFPAVSVEYRLSKDGVTPVDAVKDACAAIAWMRKTGKLGSEVKRVAAYGMSAGGHLAAATVTVGCPGIGEAGRADALLLWSPALAVEHDGWFQRLLGDGVAAADWSPNLHLDANLPPTAIVIGDEDTLTPMAGSQVFCDGVRAAGARCEMFVYPGVGHLLTRNLENQESDFDVDPETLQDAKRKLADFLLAFDAGKLN